MAKKFDIEKFNLILENHGQTLRAKEIDGKKILLSNGFLLSDIGEIRKCKRRVLNESPEYVSRFDELYSNDSDVRDRAESYAKSDTSRKGGIRCQEVHGTSIRDNLNTGTPWNKGKKLHYDVWHKGKTKEDNESLRRLSEDRMGNGNPMHGTKMSDEQKKLRSDMMRDRILSGEFTPNSNNRNTHWESSFNGKKYRSSWEAVYHALYPEAEYETLRIEYNYQNSMFVYIVDFINHNTKEVIEVKPSKMIHDAQTSAKINALTAWAKQNNYSVVIADETYLSRHDVASVLHLLDKNTARKISKIL